MMDMRQLTLLHVSLISGVGPAAVDAFVRMNTTDSDWRALYAMTAHDIVVRYGCTMHTAQRVVDGLRDTRLLDTECALLVKHGIEVMVLGDQGYHEYLTHIHCAPIVLYYKGVLSRAGDTSLAVIGSRKADRYGAHAIKTIVPPLAKQGWTIVSGGALGADTMAHQAALEAGGSTVAVLGSGLLSPYPMSNNGLFKRIVDEGGALVSPFPLKMQALPGNFPARNRIISGMSRATVVVQAAQRSGTSITARYALDQGREVFAVPGAFDNPLSAGCHELIRQGAHIACSADDISREFVEIRPVYTQLSTVPAEPETVEQRVLLTCTDAIGLSDLGMRCAMPEDELVDLLFMLQLAGKVRQNFAGMWQKI